jgi:hypothetical protein
MQQHGSQIRFGIDQVRALEIGLLQPLRPAICHKQRIVLKVEHPADSSRATGPATTNLTQKSGTTLSVGTVTAYPSGYP